MKKRKRLSWGNVSKVESIDKEKKIEDIDEGLEERYIEEEIVLRIGLGEKGNESGKGLRVEELGEEKIGECILGGVGELEKMREEKELWKKVEKIGKLIERMKKVR